MKLFPLRDRTWTEAKSDKDCRCALSGEPIKIGDDVYVSATSDHRVLASKYLEYFKQRATPDWVA